MKVGGGAGCHFLWEDLSRSCGRICLLLGDSVKGDKFKFRDPETSDPYRNRVEGSQLAQCDGEPQP